MTRAARHSFFAAHRLIAILVICWLAFGLRVFRLDTQSLWYDEGLSVHLAAMPFQTALSMSAITDHPPLHVLLLGAWMRLAGQSEFAVRFVSVWWSVLAVGLTWRLGRAALTEAIGVIGAALLAVSAFAVWYAQEARGYSLLLALTLIATWAFVILALGAYSHGARPHRFAYVRSRVGWAWVALVISGIAALYTHYYAVFTLLALNLAFWATLACRMKRVPSRNAQYAICFWLSQLVIVAGFAPWLPAALQQAVSNVTYFPGRIGWQTVVGDTLRAFAVGDAAPTTLAALTLSVMLGLAVVGVFAEQPGTTRLNRVVVTLCVAAPLAAMSIIAWHKPKFASRYLIEALPPFYLLVGAGFTALWRFAGRGVILSGARRTVVLVCTGSLLVFSVISLRATYFDTARQRPDVRSAAAYITANEQPGDVIVLLSGHQSPVFGYYYRGASAVVPMPDGIMPPAQSPLDYRAARELQYIANGHGRLWLVLWHNELADPTGVVVNELLSKARRLGVGRDLSNIRLMLFDLQGHAPFDDGPQHGVEWRFAEPITLAGYDLSAASARPGESLELALYWRASGRIGGNYHVFTHLLAPDGRMVAGSDHIAGADSYPTSLWVDGSLIRNTFVLHIPGEAQSGLYGIEVGLYDSRGRLNLAEGANRILLTQIVIQ